MSAPAKNTNNTARNVLTAMLFFLAAVPGAGCHLPRPDTPAPAPAVAGEAAPVRFLLTFDDGPSGLTEDNPTLAILEQLAANSVQPGIKAVFFVQPRHPRGGGTEFGRALLYRIHQGGHLLALHNGSERGHVNHVHLEPDELERSLEHGIADIREVTGAAPRFIKPPYLAYSSETLARYERHQLDMILDDVQGRDGAVHFFYWNPRLHAHLHRELADAAAAIQAGRLPVIADAIPLIVTLHDTNTATAENLELYLRVLIDSARAVGLRVAEKPFFDSLKQLDTVLVARALHSPGATRFAAK